MSDPEFPALNLRCDESEEGRDIEPEAGCGRSIDLEAPRVQRNGDLRDFGGARGHGPFEQGIASIMPPFMARTLSIHNMHWVGMKYSFVDGASHVRERRVPFGLVSLVAMFALIFPEVVSRPNPQSEISANMPAYPNVAGTRGIAVWPNRNLQRPPSGGGA